MSAITDRELRGWWDNLGPLERRDFLNLERGEPIPEALLTHLPAAWSLSVGAAWLGSPDPEGEIGGQTAVVAVQKFLAERRLEPEPG